MFTHVSLDSPKTQENRNTNCTILIFMVRKPVQKAKQFAQGCTYSKWQVWAFTLALQFQKQNHSTWPWVLCLAICITYTWISSRDKPEDTSILKNRDLKRNTTPLEEPWARSISILSPKLNILIGEIFGKDNDMKTTARIEIGRGNLLFPMT